MLEHVSSFVLFCKKSSHSEGVSDNVLRFLGFFLLVFYFYLCLFDSAMFSCI